MELKRDRLLQGGRYRIIESIGRGGFGITYLAEQVMAKRKVCIKEFFPKDYYKRDGDTGALTLSSDGFAESMNKFKAKFVKEAQTIATLDHHNIIPIYDVFEENNTAYYVMEYIDGVSLSSIVKESGALSEDVAVGYIKQVASALAHIHEQQIMHLDVKPGNIMVRSKDDHAILIDFGLSKHYDENSGEATSTTPVGVSHGYAPIEQYKQGGVNRFSPETDIYSLGATLYYIATGIVPPHAADMGKDGIGELPSELSSGVCAAIRKSMNYWKEDRPHTIKEFLALLDNDEPIVAVIVDEEEKTKIVTPQSTPQPKVERPKLKTQIEPAPKLKRSRWWVWLLGLLLIGGGAWFIFSDNKEEKNTEREALPEENVDSEVLPEENVENEALPETSAPYKVGDLYNENGKQGVVFEVWDNGHHGKIVSLDETGTRWDPRVESKGFEYINGTVTGANSYSDGKVNTDKVMQRGDSDQYPPFVWCRKKGADWYLPAKEELEAIFNNKSKINSTLAKYDAKLNGLYWSSTEFDDSEPAIACALAWFVNMNDGYTNCIHKYSYYGVRAVSAF